MAKTSRATEVEPIERLEDKVRQLVAAFERLRAQEARVLEDNQRLARELEAARQRLAQAEGASGEVVTLRQERDVIRARVADMLEQLETLNI